MKLVSGVMIGLSLVNFVFAGVGREGGTPAIAKESYDEANKERVKYELREMIKSETIRRRLEYIVKYEYLNAREDGEYDDFHDGVIRIYKDGRVQRFLKGEVHYKPFTKKELAKLERIHKDFVRDNTENKEFIVISELGKIPGVNITQDELLEDIRKSPYRIVDSKKGEKCKDDSTDEGVARFATSVMNDRNGEICFDLEKAYDYVDKKQTKKHLITYKEFLTIMFHEHLHHFGYADKDHKLGAKFAEAGERLPWNLHHGSCDRNVNNGSDYMSYNIWAFNLPTKEEVEKNKKRILSLGVREKDVEEFYSFELDAKEAYRKMLELSGCSDKDIKEDTKHVSFDCRETFIKYYKYENDREIPVKNPTEEEKKTLFKTSRNMCDINSSFGEVIIYFSELDVMNVVINRHD